MGFSEFQMKVLQAIHKGTALKISQETVAAIQVLKDYRAIILLENGRYGVTASGRAILGVE